MIKILIVLIVFISSLFSEEINCIHKFHSYKNAIETLEPLSVADSTCTENLGEYWKFDNHIHDDWSCTGQSSNSRYHHFYCKFECPDGLTQTQDDSGNYHCEIVCPPDDYPERTEPVSHQECPPPYQSNPQTSCEIPCESGTVRNSAGGCCPIGFTMSCKSDGGTGTEYDWSGTAEQTGTNYKWSSCECPYGTDFQDGTCKPKSCPDGSYLSQSSGECISCSAGQVPNDNDECSPFCDPNHPFSYPLSNAQCEATIIVQAGEENAKTCYSCSGVPSPPNNDDSGSSDSNSSSDNGNSNDNGSNSDNSSNDDSGSSSDSNSSSDNGNSNDNGSNSDNSSNNGNNGGTSGDGPGLSTTSIEKKLDDLIQSSNTSGSSITKKIDDLMKSNKDDNKAISKQIKDSSKGIEKKLDGVTSAISDLNKSMNGKNKDGSDKLKNFDFAMDGVDDAVKKYSNIKIFDTRCSSIPTLNIFGFHFDQSFLDSAGFISILRPIVIFMFAFAGIIFAFRRG